MDGLEFCRALRATDWGQSMYVIMLTGEETEEKIIEAICKNYQTTLQQNNGLR